ncbi:MAG: NAD(P)-dependent oxidoreductase [Chloroflexi bacterium]|nr:NAD(P)-dependent oxidoreductase [Chloroflexota bacterium]
MTKRKVVVTGAAGYIFSRMIAAFRERYDLTLHRNRDNYRRYFQGADVVVHCGFIGSMGGTFTPGATAAARDLKFQAELTNVQMAHNVYQVSVEEGVRRAVVCSSNHAADYYERLVWADRYDVVDERVKTASDNYYGWAKEAYEDLGFVFATGVENSGQRLQNVQLRIGGPRETDIDQCDASDLKKMRRALGAYLSARDQIQLFVKAIEAEHIEDDQGVPFQIFYGISDNDHKFWSIAHARKVIGYAPEDNSAIKFADKIARIAQQAQKRDG